MTATTTTLSVDVADPTAPLSSPEEGQEALWIEVEPSPSPVNDAAGKQVLSSTNLKGKAQPGANPAVNAGGLAKDTGDAAAAVPAQTRLASFRFPSPLRAHRNGNHNNRLNNGKKGKSSTSHVLLMDPQHTVVTTRLGQAKETPHDIQRAAIHKAHQARTLLKQASSQPDPKRRTEWAQSAFATGLEARLLVEPSVTDDLQQLLQSVCQSGIDASSKPRGMGEAFMCLGQIIDCVGSATTTAPGSVMMMAEGGAAANDMTMAELDDISTLGFDNTFEMPQTPRLLHDDKAMAAARAAAAANAAELLSVTSLNEILDAPMDAPTPHGVVVAAPLPAAVSAAAAARKEAAATKARPPLFGGVIKKRSGGPPAGGTAAEVDGAAATKAKAKRRWRRKSRASAKAKGAKEAEGAVEGERRTGRMMQRFSATVVAEDNSDPEDDDLQPTVEELRAHEVDLRMHAKLQEALQNDGSESIISLHGVPLHGMDVTKKKKEKKKTSAKGATQAQGKSTDEGPAPVLPKVKPQMFDKVKPTFTAAPRGDAHILMQKSWESLEEGGALGGAPVLVPPPPPPPPPPNSAKGRGGTSTMSHVDNVEIDPTVVPLPSKSPASSTASSPSRGKAGMDAEDVNGRVVSSRRGDKYLVDPTAEDRTDRYAPADNNEVEADSFEDQGDRASCPPFLQSCMDVVRPPRPAQEAADYSAKASAIGVMADAERYVPVDVVEEEMETPVVVDTAEKAPSLPAKKSTRWKIPLFGRGGRKQKGAVVVPPLPSEDVSTVSRPASKGRPVSAPRQKSSAKPRNRGRTADRTEPSRPAPIVPRHQQTAQTGAPTTPQQYATVVSPPPVPNMNRPFAAFQSSRSVQTRDLQAPPAAPGFNVKSPAAETTTAVEQLVRTLSKQGSLTVPKASTAPTSVGVPEAAADPTPSRRRGAPNLVESQLPPHSAGPTFKPTSPSFFGSRLGPFGGKSTTSNSKTAKGAATVTMGASRPPPVPAPPARQPAVVALATTASTAAVSVASSLAATATADSASSPPMKSDFAIGEGGHVDRRDDDLAEGEESIPPNLTANTTTEDSAMTEDSLVHLIKEQQKRDKRNRLPKKQPSPPADRRGRGRLRGLEPTDRDAAMATNTFTDSSSSRGIDP